VLTVKHQDRHGIRLNKGDSEMTTTSDIVNDAAQIRERMDSWAKAVRAKDVNGVMSHYAADILTFDLAPPLEYKGADAYRKNWEAWFPTFRGPIGYEIHDLSITASDDIAFCHSLNRICGARTNGEETDVWVRATVCYRKIGGTWVITHEHVSVPIYMDGYRAALDLKP
jgi:ketosteroid isomerase-like protein